MKMTSRQKEHAPLRPAPAFVLADEASNDGTGAVSQPICTKVPARTRLTQGMARQKVPLTTYL